MFREIARIHTDHAHVHSIGPFHIPVECVTKVTTQAIQGLQLEPQFKKKIVWIFTFYKEDVQGMALLFPTHHRYSVMFIHAKFREFFKIIN